MGRADSAHVQVQAQVQAHAPVQVHVHVREPAHWGGGVTGTVTGARTAAASTNRNAAMSTVTATYKQK